MESWFSDIQVPNGDTFQDATAKIKFPGLRALGSHEAQSGRYLISKILVFGNRVPLYAQARLDCDAPVLNFPPSLG
jgi:hypothetical protein